MNPELEKAAKNYFKGMQAIIIDPSSMTRTSIRKFIESLGIPNNAILQSDNCKDGLELIKTKKPSVVFSEFELANENAFKVLATHVDVYPLRSKCCFTVYASHNSPTLTASLADSDVDVFMTKPFTLDAFKDRFFESISYKLKASKFNLMMDEAKAELRTKNIDKAVQLAKDAIKENPQSAKPYALLGQSYLAKGESHLALEMFEQGLAKSPENYCCLKHSIIIYMQEKKFRPAYEMALIFSQHYSLPAEMLPFLIKAALANEKFEDIKNFHRLFMAIGEESEQRVLAPTIAAGLTLTGQWLYKHGEEKDALDSLAKAEKIAKDRIPILKKITTIYLEFKQLDLAEKTFDAIEASGKLPAEELKLLELEVKADSSPPPEVIKLARNALQEGIKSPRIYEILLRKYKEIGRDQKVCQELAEEAVAKFPEAKSLFAAYLS